MKCKETKDWFYCLASKGIQFLWSYSCAILILVFEILAYIVTTPLVIVGWIKEKSE